MQNIYLDCYRQKGFSKRKIPFIQNSHFATQSATSGEMGETSSSIIKLQPSLPQILHKLLRRRVLHGIESHSFRPRDMAGDVIHEKNLLGSVAGFLGGGLEYLGVRLGRADLIAGDMDFEARG